MASKVASWGIDLGQCALKAIRLQEVEGTIEVLDHVYIEHAKILSQPDVDKQSLVNDAISKFTDDHDLSKDELFVAVPGLHTLAKFTKLPPVEKKKITEIVKYEAQQQIPFDMDEVIWDYQVFMDEEGLEPEVGIFAMRRESLRDHLGFLSEHSMEPAGVQASPLALYNALKYDGIISDKPAAVIDIGAQNTDLVITDGVGLWTRNIPLGGNNFTEALMKTFKLSFRKAEHLKRDAAKNKYARQIFQAMRPVFADLVSEIQRSVGFYTSSRRGVKLNQLIAMGNAFKLPGLQKFIQQNLGMEVVRPTSFNKLSMRETPKAPELMDHLLSYGVAYGLALQGLGEGQVTSNLLPPEIARTVVWRRKTPWFYAAAACLALSGATVLGRNMMDSGAISAGKGEGSARVGNFSPSEDVLQDLELPQDALRIVQNGPSPTDAPKVQAEKVIAAGRSLQSALSAVEQANQPLIQEAQNLADQRARKAIWPEILYLIHSSLPELEGELAEAWSEGPSAYREFIRNNGTRYPREQREQIFIERISSQHSEDVMASYETAKARSMPGTSKQIASTGLPQEGFLITIVGRTPKDDRCDFVDRTFITSLLEASGDMAYIQDAYLVRCDRLREVGSGGGGSYSGGRGGFGGGGLGNPAGGGQGFGGMRSASAGDSDEDPITGENILNDWEFELLVAAVIGEEPAEGANAPGGVPPQPGRPGGVPDNW